MSNPTATARLALDASGFDKQANASFREFSKQLTSVKDATDVAMRGAEALQKVFVKSLGGTIAIGAANALGDAMRDVGNRIGAAGDAAAQAMAGMTGFSGSLEEAAARAQTLASGTAQISKSLEELRNASPIQAAIFKLFGGEQVLSDLEETTKGLAGLELLTGLQQGNRSSQRLLQAGPEGQKAEEQRMADEKSRRDLQSSAAFRGADPATQGKIMAEFEKKLQLRESLATQQQEAKDQKEFQKVKTDLLKKLADYQQDFTEKMLDRDLEDARKAREAERESADLLAEAQTNLAKLLQDRATKEKETAGRGGGTAQTGGGTGTSGQLAGGLLGASRAGQSAMQVAEKQRAREVSREDFRTQQAAFTSAAEQESSRTGLNLTAQDMRKRVAATEAARANPSMADRNNAAQMGMDPGEFAAQRASFKAGLGNAAAGMSTKEIDSQFRNRLQKDAEQQKQGKAGANRSQGDIYKLLEETLRKLTSAPVINI